MAGIKANNIRLRDDGNAWVSLADWDVQDIIHSDSPASIGDMLNNIVENENAIAAQTDTKNTAGASAYNGQSLYLIGATEQTENPQTYTNGLSAQATTGAITLNNGDNRLSIVKNIKLNSAENGIIINNDNGNGSNGADNFSTQLQIPSGTWVLGAAAVKNVDTASVPTGSGNLPTSKAVLAAIQNATSIVAAKVPQASNSPATTITSGAATAGESAESSTLAAYSRFDHVHNIALTTGDENGQVKIAGKNVSVKGLAAAAYRPVASTITDATDGALITAATVSAAISSTVSSIQNSINNLKKVHIGKTTPTGTEEIWLYRNYDITQQPQNVILNALGETANFVVETGDPNATYQWKVEGGSSAEDFEGVSGINTNILTVITDNDNFDLGYHCSITFETGATIDSNVVRTIIYHIITQPQNATVAQTGKSVTFKVETGDPRAQYQWEYQESGQTNWNSISGATTSTLTFNASTNNQGWTWHCKVTFDNETTETSDEVTYTVASS